MQQHRCACPFDVSKRYLSMSSPASVKCVGDARRPFIHAQGNGPLPMEGALWLSSLAPSSLWVPASRLLARASSELSACPFTFPHLCR